MKSPRAKMALYLFAGILVAGVLPLVLYWPSFNLPPLPGAPESLPVREVALFEQWLVVVTAFVVKPTYMMLSLAWIVWLWRRDAPDLAALRWGLIWFLGGETACAINYGFLGGHSALTDYLHSYGMVVGFSFVTYAGLEGTDLRLIKYSAPKERCAALNLCRSCIKYAEVPCGLRRLFMWLIPALIVVAFMMPSASLKVVSHRTDILGSAQDYCNPLWSQIFESRYCAWLSIFLLLVSWAVLAFKRENPVAAAKLFFAAGAGPLGFGLMRLFLRAAYSDNLVWSNIWEELTELIFILGVGFVLWVFRASLFRTQPREAASQTASSLPPA